MATYLTQEGYDKKMAELAELEAQRPAIKTLLPRPATRATCLKTLSMTQPRKLKACLR